MAKRRRKASRPRSRRKGVTFTDDQKLQLLASTQIDEATKKKILNA